MVDKYEITESSISAGSAIVIQQIQYTGDDGQSIQKNVQRLLEDVVQQYSYGHVASGVGLSAGGGALVDYSAGEFIIGGRYCDLSGGSVTLTANNAWNYIYAQLDGYTEGSTRDPRNESFTLHASGSYTPAFTRLLLGRAYLNAGTAEQVTQIRQAPDFSASNIYPSLNTSIDLYSYYGNNIASFMSGTTEIHSDLYIQDNLYLSGTALFKDTITYEAATYFDTTLTTVGAGIIGGTFTASGAANLLSTLDVTGDFDVNSKFSVVAATGNTGIDGTLSVAQDFDIATNKFNVSYTTGNVDVAGNIDVVGAIYGGSTNQFQVTSAGAISTTSTLSVGGQSDFTGAVHLIDIIDVDGVGVFGSNLTASGTIYVDTITELTTDNGVAIEGVTLKDSDITANDITTTGTLSVADFEADSLTTDSIVEKTTDNGVYVESVHIENGVVSVSQSASFAYTSPQTFTRAIAPYDFNPILSSTAVTVEGGTAGGGIKTTSSNVQFTASLQIPHGAVLTDVRIEGDSTANWYVRSKAHTSTSISPIGTTSGAQMGETMSGIAETINNQNNSYTVTVELDAGEYITGGYFKFTSTAVRL